MARHAASQLITSFHQDVSASVAQDRHAVALRLGEHVREADIDAWHRRGGPNGTNTVPEMLADACVDLLKDAPLTINIEPHIWFAGRNRSRTITNFWERMSVKGAGYAAPREDAEERMFGYQDQGRSVTFQRGGQSHTVNVGNEISRYGGSMGLDPSTGVPTNPRFVGSMRPKSSAVNYSLAKYGAAPDYGRSHFVLRYPLRFNATYTHRDAFGVERRDQVSTWHNLYRTLRHVADYVLLAILERSRAPDAPPDYPPSYLKSGGGDGSKGSQYIEAAVHADIDLRRDVECLRVANIELNDKQTGDPKTNKIWTVKGSTMRRNLLDFARRNGIQVVYI
jgi:hypothetical protein